MAELSASKANARVAIEHRSIDYIPVAERHGKPWHPAPIWILCTANLLDLALGTVGVLNGLSLGWSILAILLGTTFGTFFSAFHSSQGPQLGLPQMIQSRPQFGYRGALLIYVVAIATFVLFNIFSIVQLGEVGEFVFGVPKSISMVLATVASTLIAVVGYNLVHHFSRWITVAFLVAFGLLTVVAPFAFHFPEASLSGQGFSVQIFLLQTAIGAATTLSWAPFVSDYTRYLPHRRTRTQFLWSFVAMSGSAFWVLSLGAVIAAAFPQQSDIIQAFGTAGDQVFQGFGSIILIVAALGSILLVTMDTYGGSLTVISIIDTFRPIRPTAALRAWIAVAIGALSLFLAFVVTGDMLATFSNLFIILLYLLSPWTAINLVDFFFVRHGNYSIREIFNPRGMYGLWNWRGYTAYVAGLVAIFPFATTTWWSGPISSILGYDIAPYVGILVSGVVFLLLGRGIDLAAELRHIAEADAGLEEDGLAGSAPAVDRVQSSQTPISEITGA
jgi:purine-cytosine permease-like protein